jgi:hypothetical protein
MGTFWRRFLPLQLWRFVWINLRMYLIASGRLGPSKRGPHSQAPANTADAHRPA